MESEPWQPPAPVILFLFLLGRLSVKSHGGGEHEDAISLTLKHTSSWLYLSVKKKNDDGERYHLNRHLLLQTTVLQLPPAM